MDTATLKREFGDDITFWGGTVDPQKMLARGTPQEVHDETVRRIEELKPGGGFVIASVLRLAVYARRDEIDIMLLVGATPGFVRGPFLVAGFVQGLVGSALAVILVEVVRRSILAYTGANSGALLSLIAFNPLSGWKVFLLLSCGILVSLAGSFFAVRNSFKGPTSR